MQKVIIIGAVVIVAASGWWWFESNPGLVPMTSPSYVLETQNVEMATSSPDMPAISVVGENLEVPWEVLFLPDGEILVTERSGTVVFLRAGVEVSIENISATGEGGLLGAALHPDFADNGHLYLYETTQSDAGLINRISRYVLEGTTLTYERTIIDQLPGARYHDGGRIAFGPDGYLYATVGDATRSQAAQNPESLEGTIIRLTAEGEVPSGNPFGNPVYSYGHRNPQGLAWDTNGQLWSTEHGRSGVLSGYDELNRIKIGANYGWPEIQGDETAADMNSPIRHSGADTTWAPASLVYANGSLFFAGLRGETLYEAALNQSGQISSWREHLLGEYGRLRTVTLGPDGMLYLTTSNRDGRGDEIAPNDDRIFRLDLDRMDEI